MNLSTITRLGAAVFGSVIAAFGELPELERQVLTHDGRTRLYFIHYPGNQRPTTSKPVVFVLHGGGGAHAAELARRTGCNTLADREDFLVVYPAGVEGQWNDSRGKTFRRAEDNTDVDDVGFIAAILDRLIGDRLADASRVYVTGMSNGGMMTYRLGIELGDRLAAIAALIANLPANLARHHPRGAPPVMIMNGTDDPMMPYNGGAVRVFGRAYGQVLSTDQTVQFWCQAAHLSVPPVTERLADRVPDDHSTVEIDRYTSHDGRREVILYRIVGGGHNLPSVDTPNRPRLLGVKNLDIHSTKVVWAFFKRHTRAA